MIPRYRLLAEQLPTEVKALERVVERTEVPLSSRNNHLILIAILALSVLLRVGVALYLGNGIEETRGGTFDQMSYDMLAQRVTEGHGFSFAVNSWPYARANQPTAFWSYLYTLYLAAVYALFGHYPLIARLIQAVAVGLLMPWLIYRIGRRAFGTRVGLIAAALAAVYFYFVHYAASLMSEAFYIVGILWTVDAGMRLAESLTGVRPPTTGRVVRLGLELGVAMAVTLLLRQVVIGFFAVLVLWLLWLAVRNKALRPALAALAASALVFLLLISPFVVRNYRVFGELAMPNTNAGFTFFWSNHPIYGTRFEAALSPSHGVSYQELIPPELRDLNEARLDRALLARGLQFVRDDPGRYLLLSLSRIPVFFQFWPTPNSTLLEQCLAPAQFRPVPALHALWPGPGHPRRASGRSIALVAGARKDAADPSLRSRTDLRLAYLVLFLLFIVVYTAIHLASWANVRYRLPVDAFLILFAAYGLDHLLRRLIERKDRRMAAAQSELAPGERSHGIQCGRLILVVPSHMWLYGNIDRAIGHYRRYDK